MAFAASDLDPRGRIHIPIGIANSLDSLKTFVEPEGCFSPGFATYGIYFWVFDRNSKRLYAPTMNEVRCEYGLSGQGHLMPWFQWYAGKVIVRIELCQVETPSPAGPVQVVKVDVRLVNTAASGADIAFYAVLRPVGPAGGPVRNLAVSQGNQALLVDGHPAIVGYPVSAAGVLPNDSISDFAMRGDVPTDKVASSESGDCSGAMRFDLPLRPTGAAAFRFVCPVLAGRRAVRHRWDGTSDWAQLDLAEPNLADGGILQSDLGVAEYCKLRSGLLQSTATKYWQNLVGKVRLNLPDNRWAECFAAIIGHAAMAMNEGAPDVAVVNYNVFNRDGVYVANILQKSGNFDLAGAAIDYFIAHPFNGRTHVEADNPGQILWAMGEHWRFTRDAEWLLRIWPAAEKIAAMIRYYRTTPGPHYVKAGSLEFGDNLPPDQPDEKSAYRRQVLKPGSCDGYHPEYTEAFDIAGHRAAATLAQALGKGDDAKKWQGLADDLMKDYDERFGKDLPKDYGNYCVLWPCRLYPFGQGKAYEQFCGNGPTGPNGWRYFALARAHQGLLTGNRQAGYQTINNHLDHPQMKGWYVFDEGGKSGSGGWRFARTTWEGSVAMPHGWAIAEMWLLLRDCLAYEEQGRLYLLPGVPPEWFTSDRGMIVQNLPTYFGNCSFRYEHVESGAELWIIGNAAPPDGFVLCVPVSLNAEVSIGDKKIAPQQNGEFVLPWGTQHVKIRWR
jgi:hypothetical protein